MKPIRLDISGLNSFRQKQSIRFDLLLQEGLFGIFGPTGSGKSSILDAMTLALYGEVKRAPRKHGGVINILEKNCTVEFTFEIGHGSERRRYSVARHLVRTKSDGTETRRVWLREHRDGQEIPIAEKEKEVAEKIGEILGITLDDFLRAVVLPQGAFAGFLSLKPSERGDVLQRLFGLNEFGATLGRKLGRVVSETQRGQSEYAGRLIELGKYDDEGLRGCEDAVTVAADRRDVAAAEYQRLARHHADCRALFDLIAERDRLMSGTADRAREETRLRELRQRIELAERSRAVDPAVRAAEDAKRRYAAATAEYEKAVQTRAEIDRALAVARDRHIRANREYADRFESLGEDLVRLEEIGREKRGLREQKRELEALASAMEEYAAELMRATGEYDALIGETTRIEGELERLGADRDALMVSAEERERARKLDRTLAAVVENTKHGGLAERRAAEHAATVESTADRMRELEEREQAHAESFSRLKLGLDENKRRLEMLSSERDVLTDRYRLLTNALAAVDSANPDAVRTRLESVGKRILETEALLAAARDSEQAAQREYDDAMRRREEVRHRLALSSLLGQLRDGSPCPLCGSTEHPVPHRPDEEEERSLGTIEAEIHTAVGALDAARLRVRDTGAAVAGEKSMLAALEEASRAADDAVRAVFRDIDEKLNGALEVRTREDLHRRAEETRERGMRLRAEIDTVTGKIAELDGVVGDTEQAGRKLAAERASLQSRLETAKRQEAEAIEERESVRAERRRLIETFDEFAPGRTIEEGEEVLREIAARERKVEEIVGRIRALDAERRAGREHLDMAERRVREATNRKQVADAEHGRLDEACRRKTEELLGRLREIVAERDIGTPVEKLIEDRQARRDRIGREYDESRREYEELKANEKVAAARVDDCRGALDRDEHDRDRLGQECALALREHGFSSVDDAREGLLDSERMTSFRREADEIEVGLKRTLERLAELADRIGDRTISAEEVIRIERELKEAEAADRAALEAYGAAQDRLRECRERNAEWRLIVEVSEEVGRRAATVEQLGRYLRGNGFVNFLANERLEDICRRASSLLQSLTSGRLELATRPEDGFFIRDNGNGGGERSTGSLSGGETFLVSLSLALALSDTIQLGRAPLEFFFLDEGFGTLDAELLETVMGALERLRSDHRSIGIITHVRQLRERITRRLIVRPPAGAIGTVVQYETA